MSRHVRRRRVTRMASLRGWSPGCRWRLDRRWRDDRTGGLRCPRNRCRCWCLRCGIVRIPSTGAEQQRQPISAARRTMRAGASGFADGFRFISTSTGIRAPRRDRSSTARRFITASLERLALTHPLTLCCVTRTRNPRHHRHLLDAGDLEGRHHRIGVAQGDGRRKITDRQALGRQRNRRSVHCPAKRKHCPRAIPFPPPSDPAAPGFAAQRLRARRSRSLACCSVAGTAVDLLPGAFDAAADGFARRIVLGNAATSCSQKRTAS